jgi:RND family efflux transporter MFP subunit
LFAVITLLVAMALPGSAQDGQDASAKPVKLMTLGHDQSVMRRQFFGQVAARQTVDLAFQVPGQLQVLNAEEGMSLDPDTLIAQLDLSGYERAVARAQANFDKASRDVERLSTLRGQAVSEVQVQDAQTQLRLAEIALAGAQDDLDHASLRAPFTALVARRLVSNFQTVNAGTPVVRLHDVSELRVDIEVPEVLFRQAGANGNVSFHAELPGDPAQYPLELREFETETSSVGQTYTITFAFSERPGGFVFPGASATVFAALEGGSEDGVVLPETAVVYDADGSAAVMVVEDGVATRTPISMELRDDGRLYMTDGPPDGTRIVTTGASQLRDGQAVRPYAGLGE